MAAAFDDAAFLEHQYLVGHAHRREPMRNDDGDAVAGQLAEVFENLRFGARIDGGLTMMSPASPPDGFALIATIIGRRRSM